ncbi:alpha/beta-hydrolase [Rhizodiscina lignyota]|uniref:Carboxylic ester hydrolase n=1 Tax=Rhizodiscina lignyota TaxID=1504668 RepID=A0A9P4IGC1_9PEZI|nr:alpha/beta-hydrolase [Rhizodiscina lignyota]
MSLTFLLALVCCALPVIAATSTAPVVDLGYALHRATIPQENSNYYSFPWIRYAAPPLGKLRFSAPQPPLNNRSAGIQDGSFGWICPQASPLWNNVTLANAPPGPNESEDCLFLDVFVSKETFKRKNANVIVWIHGGGYIRRDKTEGGSSIGLLERSAEHSEGAVFLGGFGFLNGPLFQKSGTANVGLHDQRLALSWVQRYIHLFGGDPQRVTVIGESAGAGSIMHHIAAYGGERGPGHLPFHQVICQSAALHNPTSAGYLEDDVTRQFLAAANVCSIDEARKLTSEALMAANKAVVRVAPYGLYTFQPNVDGDYVKDVLGVAYLTGRFDHSIRAISAHNSNEGFGFTDPAATNSSALATYMRIYFPHASDAVIDFISNKLYPPIYDGSQPWTTPFERLNLLISEMMIACNSRYLGTGLGNTTYNYEYSVPPGFHMDDIPYTFFDGTLNGAVTNKTMAMDLQRYITAFAATGNPNAFQKETALPTFARYGSEATLLNFNTSYISHITDPLKNDRCAWWQKGLLL